MNRDEIIRLAKEAQFNWLWIHDGRARLERFAALVAAAEREACAKVCDQLWLAYWKSTGEEDEPDAYDCAAAIRARNKG